MQSYLLNNDYINFIYLCSTTFMNTFTYGKCLKQNRGQKTPNIQHTCERQRRFIQLQTHNTPLQASGIVLLTTATHIKDTTLSNERNHQLVIHWRRNIVFLGLDPSIHSPKTNNPFVRKCIESIFTPRTGNFHQRYYRPKT